MRSRSEPWTPRQRIVIWVAILSSFVAFLDGSIVNVALPAIRTELGGGVATQQWIVNAYLLTLSALILLAGTLSDSFGRVRMLRIGLAIFGIASLACALAPTEFFLIAARAVQGAGAALLVPSSLALITAAFGSPVRGRAIGTWTAWTGVAFIAGPLLGGALVDTLGWRWIFGVNVLPILVTLALLTMLSSHEGRTGQRIDVTGAALVALGLAGPVFALIEQQRLGWPHPLVLISFIAGLISFAVFIWWERRTPNPMLPLQLFRTRNFAVGNLATAFIYAGVPLGLLTVTLFLQEVAGFSAFEAGLATVPVALMSLFLAQLFGGLAGRFGHRLFVTVGPAIAASGYLVMLTARDPLNFWLQFLPGLLLFGLGLSVTVAPLTASILESVDSRQSGIGSAINNAISRVAGLISIAFISVIVGEELDYDGFHRVVVVVAVLFLIASVISIVGIATKRSAGGSIPVEAAALCHDRTIPVPVASLHGDHENR